MLVRRRGVIGVDPALRKCLCFARRNPENLFFSENNCHPTLHSFTNNGWSLGLLDKTWQQLFYE